MTDVTSTDLDAILDDADFATIDVSICLKRSLRDAFEEADSAALRAQAAFDDAAERKLPTGGPAVDRDEAFAKVEAIEAEMRAKSVTFTVTGISAADFMEVALKHPPQEDRQEDLMRGFHAPTFFPAIVRRCLTAPVMTNAQWERVLDTLTSGQFEQLAGAVMKLNRDDSGRIPFSYAASVVNRSSGETSNAPSDSESPSGGSGDGSPSPAKKSPKTARAR